MQMNCVLSNTFKHFEGTMHLLTIFLVCVLVFGIDAACTCGVQPAQKRIFGGKAAEPNAYPWMAAVTYKFGSHLCGGALISDRYILTAAHCLPKTAPEKKRVVLGLHDLNSTLAEERLEIEAIIPHKSFTFEGFTGHNDIALVRLSKPVQFTDKIYPICMPSEADQDFDHLTVAGWGSTSNEKTDPKLKSWKLQHVVVPHVATDVCSKIWPKLKEVGPTQICAGDLERDSCGGDSGGPLMSTKGGKVYLAGIVSYGYATCGSKYPAVYTRVSSFLGWIEENTQGTVFCA